MRTEIFTQNWLDDQDRPAGGVAYGNGFAISWQNGPLGPADDRDKPNGAFVEDVIFACLNRITAYQNSKFSCDENELAMGLLADALVALDSRTKDREKRGVEGTHEV